MVQESTERLVQRYFRETGAESEQLEFKAKEKVETTAQRRDLVKILAAMANTHGGTVIIGVGPGRREDILQSFDNRSELKRDLVQTARDNTEPALTDLLTIQFEEVPPGATVLRIDVDRAETLPIKVDVGGNDGYIAYRRVGDTTKQMTVDDGVRFAETRLENPYGDQLTRTEFVQVDHSVDVPPLQDHPDQRMITSTPDDYQIVFGPGVHREGYGKAVSFVLKTRVGGLRADGVDRIHSILEAAKEHLYVDLGGEFGYSIKQGTRTLLGKHVDHFYADLQNIKTVVVNMLDGHPKDVADDITHVDAVRPTIVAYSNAGVGTFWLKVEWREDHQLFYRCECGLLLGDIPFNDTPLRTFFAAVDANPSAYQQRTGLQELTLKGQIQLQDPVSISLEPKNDFIAHVAAANPFYEQAEMLQRQAENPIPSHFLEGLCSTTHVPMFNKGMELNGDEDVVLRHLDVTYHRSTWPTLFLDATCYPKEP